MEAAGDRTGIERSGGAGLRGEAEGRPLDSTDTPIPIWPEGVLALAAGVVLLVIGLRHRTWLQRKGQEVERTVGEFRKHGGLDELAQVARHATDLFKGGQ